MAVLLFDGNCIANAGEKMQPSALELVGAFSSFKVMSMRLLVPTPISPKVITSGMICMKSFEECVARIYKQFKARVRGASSRSAGEMSTETMVDTLYLAILGRQPEAA